MGNTVVQKPSEYTTLTGLAIAAVLNEALPPGVLTAVTGAGDVGDALVRDPRVGKVMFTGSVKTGMKVIEASAGNMPRLTLELGGNDAAIVLPDVDPQAIAEGLFWGAFINNAAPLVQEEQFGPALPIIRYTDLEQAVEWANGVDVGLGASVWSADRDQALAIAARLQAGTVWINSHGGIDPRVPFGGAKRSGYGLEFGVEGLKAVSVPQVISG